jgi:uncharacterized cupin superfamily protein
MPRRTARRPVRSIAEAVIAPLPPFPAASRIACWRERPKRSYGFPVIDRRRAPSTRSHPVTDALLRIDTSGEAEHGASPADRILSGTPAFTTWNVEERDGLYCGTWRATPGKWRIEYDEWEYCRILEGVSVIAEEGGEALEVRAGDSFVLRPGFRGTWEVLETTVKEYVIRL